MKPFVDRPNESVNLVKHEEETNADQGSCSKLIYNSDPIDFASTGFSKAVASLNNWNKKES